MRLALEGIEELSREVDALIVIPNDRLLNVIDKNTACTSAFAMCDEVLRQAVEGISDLITTPGIINLDFADIRAVLQNTGSALMGIGSAIGEKRAEEAARAAINSPLLDISIEGAKGVLFAIAGGPDLTMFEIQEAAKVITEAIDKEAKVIFGAINNDKLKKNEIKVTVIASGFPSNHTRPLLNIPPKPVTQKETVEAEEPATIRQSFSTSLRVRKPEPTPASPQQHTPVVRAETVPEEHDEEDADEWSSVPAFLRRGKK